jgi:hypothetical protein
MSDTENPHAGQGSVMLDIGGDIGALVVTMPPSMLGVEIEIDTASPQHDDPQHASTQEHAFSHERKHEHEHEHGDGHGHGDGDVDTGEHRLHVAVVNRPVAGGQVPSLVFSELVAGRYELFRKGGNEVLLTADIVGGLVTSMQWPNL